MEEDQQIYRNEAMVMGRTNYAANAQQDINTLLSELTNPEKEIAEAEASLKGIGFDSEGKEIRVTDPLLNNKGTARMIQLMRSMVNRVMYMSNLEDDQIRIMTIELGEQIVQELVMHKVDYEVKDFESMSTIRTIVTYKAFEAGMSALQNGFRRFLKTGIVETTINTQGNQMPKTKGGIGSMFGLGKK